MREISIEEYKALLSEFEALCNKAVEDLKERNNLTRLEEFNNFVNFVMKDTNFVNSPASTKYHLCIPHGLLIHSVSVAKTALKLNASLKTEIPISSVLICSLFHDIGKHLDYKENQPSEKQKAAGYKANPPYVYNTTETYHEHESRSVYMITQYIKLSEEEFTAIFYHNSPWDGVTKPAFGSNKLMTLLQMSDYWSSLYLEERN